MFLNKTFAFVYKFVFFFNMFSATMLSCVCNLFNAIAFSVYLVIIYHFCVLMIVIY